ncbi:MAG: YkgJ family cysteine cluster protein [Candidatus Odinarchaeota archaeon]
MSESNGDKETGKTTPESTEQQKESKEGKEKQKYVHNCTKCGNCCKDRTGVPITVADINKWTEKGMITTLIPHLAIGFAALEGGQGQLVQLVMKKPLAEDGTQPTGCPMYDETNSLCNIYSNMPLDCASFPLGYNGQSYFIRSIAGKKSPGLGNGKMTKETLQESSRLAKEFYAELLTASTVFPMFYSLVMKDLMEQQERLRKSLSDEEKAKIDEIDNIMRGKKDSQVENDSN